MLILLWLILSIVTAGIAASKHRSFFGWLILGALLPVIAFIVICVLPRAHDARCPMCAEGIDRRARICPHCRTHFDSGDELPADGGGILARLKQRIVDDA